MNICLSGRNKTNPKDSNAYRKPIAGFHTTPKGSYIIRNTVYYKYQIPSGLMSMELANPKDSNVYSKKKEMEHKTPKGSYTHLYFIFYKHLIPSGYQI